MVYAEPQTISVALDEENLKSFPTPKKWIGLPGGE